MIRIHSRPDLDEAVALEAVREHYGLDGTLTPLPGYRDRNFLLEVEGGVRYVVKVSCPDQPQTILEFENRMIIRKVRNHPEKAAVLIYAVTEHGITPEMITRVA